MHGRKSIGMTVANDRKGIWTMPANSKTELLSPWSVIPADVRRQLDPILDQYERAWRESGQPDRQRYLSRCCEPELQVILQNELNYLDHYYSSSENGGHDSGHRSVMRIPERIGGYRVIKRVGAGGFGIVFLGFDSLTNRQVAIKVARPAWLVDRDAEELAKEARILSRLDHPNIVRFLDSGVEGHNEWFVVTEWIDGNTLQEILHERLLHPGLALKIAIQTADALCFAHQQGIAHLDIKPRNIMLDAVGNVKLVDFGVAKILAASESESKSGMRTGSLDYMSPEVHAGREMDIDAQSDIFALGLVLHEMLVGKRSQSAERSSDTSSNRIALHKINPTIPPSIDKICGKALQPDKRLRYADMGQMHADLVKCRAEAAVVDEPEYRAISLQQYVKRSRARLQTRLTAAAMICLMLFAMGMALNFWGGGAAPSANTAPPWIQGDLVPIWLKTDPGGAHVYFYQLDEWGEPIRESQFYAGRSPVQPDLPPGEYFVSVVLDNGEFNETFRAVPHPGEIPHAYFHHQWRQVENKLQLRTVSVPRFDGSNMVLVDDVWVDESEVAAADIPPFRFDSRAELHKLNGKCVDISSGAASDYLESQGKRLPFSSEIDLAIREGFVLDDKSVMDLTRSVISTTKSHVGDRGSVYLNVFSLFDPDQTVVSLEELTTDSRVGFRGVRSFRPLPEVDSR